MKCKSMRALASLNQSTRLHIRDLIYLVFLFSVRIFLIQQMVHTIE